MKQKTPLFDLKEDLIETITNGNEAFNDINDLRIRECCQEVLKLTLNAIIKRIDTELLPKEKEVIIESLKFYMNTDGIGNADGLAEVHFNETFTQK